MGGIILDLSRDLIQSFWLVAVRNFTNIMKEQVRSIDALQSKLKAHNFFLLNEQYVLMGRYISIQYMCHQLAPKRLSQLDYELNDLEISSAS